MISHSIHLALSILECTTHFSYAQTHLAARLLGQLAAQVKIMRYAVVCAANHGRMIYNGDCGEGENGQDRVCHDIAVSRLA